MGAGVTDRSGVMTDSINLTKQVDIPDGQEIRADGGRDGCRREQ
jgi:hypothetical protein